MDAYHIVNVILAIGSGVAGLVWLIRWISADDKKMQQEAEISSPASPRLLVALRLYGYEAPRHVFVADTTSEIEEMLWKYWETTFAIHHNMNREMVDWEIFQWCVSKVLIDKCSGHGMPTAATAVRMQCGCSELSTTYLVTIQPLYKNVIMEVG